MNRYLTIFIGLVVIIGLGIGAMFFLRSIPAPLEEGSAPVSTPSNTTNSTVVVPADRSNESVRAAFQSEIAPYDDDHTKLYKTVVVGEYAIQVWSGDNKGGQALLKYEVGQSQWVLISGGGGVWSLAGLVEMGVPQDTATALLQGLGQ